MPTFNWKQVREIFEAALAVADDRRTEFVRQQCGENADLSARVQKLLENDACASEGFLEPSPPGPQLAVLLAATNGPDPLIGRTIAAYTIKTHIARGGMGSVYLAEQANPRRNVALKVMYANAWSAAAEKRFDVESQILAYLRHPNIAQIFEAGTHRLETGATALYFAMEYVPEARTIIAYATDRALAPRSRLELFLQLCDAVHHGHQKGVIHRDLKPANILVDPEGRVKVIDFGIARSTDSDLAVTTMHTEVGQLLGTLAYMSPEQCAADPSQIDTTTDVYSLGVILFELLTGQMPYDVSNMTIQSAARVICEREPARPSLFTEPRSGHQKVKGDLEAIILKSIEKTPARRYGSVADLASDIRRQMSGEPISARPPTTWTKALGWAARHPVKATVLACLAIVTVIGFATAASVYVVARRPYRIELSRDGREARLLPWFGAPLATWRTEKERGLTFAQLVDRPTEYGGGKLAIIGYGMSADPYFGSLCAFSLDNSYETPEWEARIPQPELPEDIREADLTRRAFGVEMARIFDVFQESQSPGPEVVVVFSHMASRRAVCLFDLKGKLRFRVWQDGSIEDVRWMPDLGLLVCSGLDETVKLNLEKQTDRVASSPYVFAIKPEFKFLSHDYVSKQSTDIRLRPVWQRYLIPPTPPEYELSMKLTCDIGGYDLHRFTGVGVHLKLSDGITGDFDLVIDEHGDEVPGSRVLGDSYRRNIDKLPKNVNFRLQNDPQTLKALLPPPASTRQLRESPGTRTTGPTQGS